MRFCTNVGSEMKRNLSGGGVTIAGLLFAGAGAYSMWTGWDMILVERGWSLFIGGSVILSGGVITMALGRVIARLDSLAAPREAAAPQPVEAAAAVAPAPVPAAVETPAPASPAPAKPAPAPAAEEKPARARAETGASKPVEAPVSRAVAWAKFSGRSEKSGAPDFSALLNPQAQAPGQSQSQPQPQPQEPTEVDRYVAGDATYIMMSDGSVEVHSPGGKERYPTLAALKAEAALRPR